MKINTAVLPNKVISYPQREFTLVLNQEEFQMILRVLKAVQGSYLESEQGKAMLRLMEQMWETHKAVILHEGYTST
jgi:hypothetical protein